MLVVQVIEVLWSKATRGAPRSNERASLPRAFAIASADAVYVVQYHRMVEWEAFRPTLTKVEKKERIPRTESLLYITPNDSSSIGLGLTGAPYGGQPKRHPVRKAIQLHQGEYARLVINSRHATYSGQYYMEVVFNVAYGNEIPPDRFLHAGPDHELDLKGNLF